MAVFGERRVKVFRLRVDVEDGEACSVRLELEQRLPGFDHWVLDACFLEADGLLAIGLSDNSVALWDLSKRLFLTRVKSPEKCLLYSMRMWGDSVKSLLVASGTILNEILIWKLVSQTLEKSLLSSYKRNTHGVEDYENMHFSDKKYIAMHLGRLKEHEGSIFRIAWSSDGSKFMSVSDDRRLAHFPSLPSASSTSDSLIHLLEDLVLKPRSSVLLVLSTYLCYYGSARIWMLNSQSQNFVNKAAGQDDIQIIPKLTIFGHSARIWDCYVSDSIVITAGEDCSCCIWAMDGKLIKKFREHIGRGIWRCLYDPSTLLLVTAGFDSAIKVHHLWNSSFHDKVEDKVDSDNANHDSEFFSISSPTVSGHHGPLDSKSEYVRCLHFVEENDLYIATNNGYLHHAEFSNSKDVIWTEVIQIADMAPIICMDAMVMHSDTSPNREDIIALGDGRGNVTVVYLTVSDLGPKIDLSFTWLAEKDRQLLGVYWCKSLECRHIFTADPRGVLKLWDIRNALFSDTLDATSQKVPLIAVFESSFGARIMCLDVSPQDEILIAGDKKGNITAFPFPKVLVAHESNGIQQNVPSCDRFKGAHGISSVTSVHIITSTSDHLEIHTTGGDGCICLFKCHRNVQKIEFFGMRQVKELGTVQSVFSHHASENQLLSTYAIGFTSADFIIWDLENETKMLQISCGGWRRPYSYYLGTVPEYQNCFAFLKDHNIHIRRHWTPTQDKKLLPQVLHMQFHGREVHSLCFIDLAGYSNPEKSSNLYIATGCEDGTVRLTGTTINSAGRWCSSKLLGEHVGGSAVRATCFVQKAYTLLDKSCNTIPKGDSDDILIKNKDNIGLLISVGSKQVLTTWVLQPKVAENRLVCSSVLDVDSKQSSESTGDGDPAMTFQWLSTHMPPKLTNRSKIGHVKQNNDEGDYSVVQPNQVIMDQLENDWRYLSVTAFLLEHPSTKLTVCFVVVACSDATIVLRALLLPSRLWFDIALLAPQESPVLVLKHIIAAASVNCKGSLQDCSINTSLHSPDNSTVKVICQQRVPSAHSSAVKGIWTDGLWAFSTGLDQRIRCWKMEPSGRFTEYSHVIISVPEPETLDVFHERREKKYWIAVAGRGMQMVEFLSSEDD
ncbi:WD repeat-containing protein 6 isoform X2 [Oryza brachyantha]|uniref:WD repeat-containing protein 6 isoform X2 n=1 Tax=Oryza brachyantha TaxID=4533 RepID=UPI001ADA8787|nr:WD repeat-containing protein 6 isoform X2 [Oryza brachyantha]